MAQMEFLLGAVLMWLVLLAVGAALARARDWRREGVATHAGAGAGWHRGEADGAASDTGLLDRLQGRPLTASFLLLGVGVVVAALVFAAAATTGDLQGTAGTLAVVGVGFLLSLYVAAGVYVTVRSRLNSSAAATAVGGLVLGLLLLTGIVLNLIVG